MPLRKSKAEAEKAMRAFLSGETPKDKIPANTIDTFFIEDLAPFPDHPFKLYEGERLADMVRSISELGVIVPVIVRANPNDKYSYEILSGHNRVNAAKLAGLKQVPIIIKDNLSDDEARLIVTESNLVQRSFTDLSHSERAAVLKAHMDAIKSQGKRNDLLGEIETLSTPHEIKENGSLYLIGTKSERSNERVGKENGLSARNVARYMRITELIAPIQMRVDNDEIGLYPAVSLSYLSCDEQSELNRLLEENSYKVDMKKAESLRAFSESKKLTNEKMKQILSGELNKKPKRKTAPPFKLKAKIYLKFFSSDTPHSEMEAVIDKALTIYFAKRKKEQEDIQ